MIDGAVEGRRTAQEIGVFAVEVAHLLDHVDALGRVQHLVEDARALEPQVHEREIDVVVAADPGLERVAWALLAFQAVGREGLETVVFTLAIAFSTRRQGGLLVGALIGLAIALAIAFFMYRLGHRINVGRFFTIVGTLLMVFAAGLLVDAVENLQQLGWLPGATHQMWHTGAILNENSALGDIAHSFFGYAQSPTVLQAVVYLLYLACVLFVFLGIGHRLLRRVAAR